MKQWSMRIGAATVAALVLAVVSARAAEGPPSLEGKPAPDFALKTLDGKDVKLSDMKGHVVVIDFWATWCPPCRESLPHLQALSVDKEKADQGLVVWAVNAREKSDKVKEFLTTNKYTFTVPMDAGATMKEYLVRGIPTTIIVGRDGTVKKAFVGFGPNSAEAMDKAIEAALKDPKPKKTA